MNIYEEIVSAAMDDSDMYVNEGDESDAVEVKAVCLDEALEALQILSSLDMIGADGELLDENGELDSCQDFVELLDKVKALKEKMINLHDDIINIAAYSDEPSTLSQEAQDEKAKLLMAMIQDYSLFAKVGRVSLNGVLTSDDGRILLDTKFEDIDGEAYEIWQSFYDNEEN